MLGQLLFPLLALFELGAMSELSPLCEQKQTSITENSQRKLVSRNNKGSPNAKMGTIKEIKMDLHGYHPSEIVQTDVLKKIIQQTWEMGENYVTLILGHGRNRGISPGFVNTNTGYFGLEIRRALRHDKELRQWIRYTTLDCSHMGVTRVKLKPNPALTRSELDHDLLPEKKGGRQSW